MKTARLLAFLFIAALAFPQTAPKKAPSPSAKRPPATRPEPAADPNAVNDEQALIDLERHILDYIRAKNSKDMEPWMSDDFQYSDASGKTLDREQFLNVVKSVQGDIEWLSADEVHVRIFGGIAVLTGIQQSRISTTPSDVIAGPDAPPPISTRSAFTDVFRRRGSTWELVMVYAAGLGAADAASSSGQPPTAKPAAPEKPAKPPANPKSDDAPPPLRKPPGAN